MMYFESLSYFVHDPLVGKPLSKAALGDGIAIGAVVRDETVHIGEDDFVVQTGDRLVLFAERDHVNRVEKIFRVALEYF